MKNIVILGAGFGGLRTALQLERKIKKLHDLEWSIILIDKNSYHTYTAALYEAASAYQWKGIENIQKFEEALGGSVSLPIRRIISSKNINFIQGTVIDVDFWNNAVKLSGGDVIPYEYLVFALGAETVYYGIQGAEKCCYALKTLEDAFRIRRRIEDIFAQKKDGEPVRMVIVGGGATGVEIISEIATYTKHLARDYNVDYKNILIFMFESRATVLASFARSQRDAVVKRLEKLGVIIRANSHVQEVMPECVLFEKGDRCDADMILWSGGIKGPSILSRINGLERNNKGQIIVDKFLQAKGLRKVFGIGDNAVFVDEKTADYAPATIFIAEQQADIVAENITRAASGQPLIEYKVSIPGYVISCGGKYAVAYIFGITLRGFLGWGVKKLIDLKYFLSIFSFHEALMLWLRELRLFTKND